MWLVTYFSHFSYTFPVSRIVEGEIEIERERKREINKLSVVYVISQKQ